METEAIVNVKRWGRILKGGLVVALGASCGGSNVTPASPVNPPMNAASAPSVPPAAPLRKELDGIEVPVVHVVLNQPRFGAARDRERAKDWSGAAHAFDLARASGTAPGKEEACALGFESGRLHLAAGENAEAAAAFDEVTSECTLSAYASLHGAQACARIGRADDAIARARRVPDDATIGADAKLLVAEALAAKGDRAAALVMWRAMMTASPHGVRWVDTAVKIANALLDGVDGDPTAHAHEALDMASRVLVEAPKLGDASGAQAAHDRAVALLVAADKTFKDVVSDVDRARRAQAWLDSGDPARALADATPIAMPSVTPASNATQSAPTNAACKAAITRAQATAKLRGATADAWGDAIQRCANDDTLVSALYSGAKASASSKRPDEAIARYAEVEKLFPHHRLADDARFLAALIVQSQGDDARFETMLTSLPTLYPEADMRGEALFRVALAHMARGDWAGAEAPLDQIVALEKGDLRWSVAGRAAYFRARAAAATAQTEADREDAANRYAAVIASAPLAFYMTQAYARLSETDPARAKKTIDEAIARETVGPLMTRAHDELHAPAFAIARSLLEVGEVEDAKRELAAAHLSDTGVDPEVLWTIAQMYNDAGAPEIGHGYARAKLTDFLGHYPSGRWRTCWEIAFPRPFEDLVTRSSAANAIPTVLTWAIMREESSFVADAKSSADAFGLMQLIVPTARGVAKGTGLGSDENSLKRPEVSIALGTKLLAGLRASFPANRALAIAAYNGGGGAVGRWVAARPQQEFDLWVEQIPYEETRGYIKRVLASETAYAFLYAPKALDEVLAIPPKVSR